MTVQNEAREGAGHHRFLSPKDLDPHPPLPPARLLHHRLERLAFGFRLPPTPEEVAAFVSDPCDGRTQGTTGMFDSLPYRNDAAIVLRRLIRSLPRRSGVMGIATCDKGLPAMMMALAGCRHLPGNYIQ